MKKLLFSSLFLLILSNSLFARQGTQLTLIGVVYRELDINVGDSIRVQGNSEYIIVLEDSTGQKNTHYLQYNQELNFNKSKLTKVTVYAP